MIDIHSGNTDRTSDQVADYITYLSPQIKSKTIYGGRSTHCVNIIVSNDTDKVDIIDGNGNKINIRFKAGWLRRGIVALKSFVNFNAINKPTQNHLIEETDAIRDFIYFYSLRAGSYEKEKNNNKLKNLLLAKKSGLKVPTTLVTNSKNELKKFISHYKSTITKPIHNGHLYYIEDGFYYTCKGTQFIDEHSLSKLDSEFSLSLFQQYIEKEIEIRIFFWGKNFYSMAIFSQLDDHTKIDYRNYNKEKPNRCVPFSLESTLRDKIIAFIEQTGLDTGSIDMILTPSGEYYFLEVNPTGQFGWLSDSCNFYLEKKIALNLIKQTNNSI